ncbi:MAG: hypothetical protein MJ126_09820 [Lachnospiraceae bacterium]|nr:hypothetical protein [Lachnospiraceae bacterium]
MNNKDLNSTHIFYVGGISGKELIEVEKALTEVDTTNEIRYIITNGYGFNTGSVQIEARWEDIKIFVAAVEAVTNVIKNHKPLWQRDEDDLF